jgi:single-strand DNA-binding protein
MNLNLLFVAGRLTRDPQLKYSQKGMPIAEIGMAVNREWTEDGQKKRDVLYVDLTCFGRTAEIASQYLRKGDPVFFEAHLRLERWQDNQGQQRNKLTVIGDRLQLAASKPRSQNDSPTDAGASPPQHGLQDPAPTDQEPDDISFL